MRLQTVAFAALVLTLPRTAQSQDDGALTLETAPPVVVKTVPETGSKGVDPGLAEIKVTFSKGMRDKNWSWTQNTKENFPPIVGGPKYLKDGRTCVIKVKLKPNYTYVVGMNSNRFSNFKDVDGRPAMPYLLVFRTGPPK